MKMMKKIIAALVVFGFLLGGAGFASVSASEDDNGFAEVSDALPAR